MKRYIKYFGFIICIFVLLFSLTSCFTNAEYYTEWELSDDMTVLTDGETTYEYYDGNVTEYWRETGNNCFTYGGDVQTEGMIAEISRPIDDDNIICLDFYEEFWGSYKFSAFYTTDTGKNAFTYMSSSTIYGNTYLLDYYAGESARMSDELKDTVYKITNGEYETLPVETNILNNADKLEVVSYGLGGFLKHVHGVFYFYRTNVYYLDTDGFNQETLDNLGYLNGADTFDVVVLDSAARELLDANCEEMEELIYNVEYEEPMFSNENTEADFYVAKTVLSLVALFFGIIFPLVPLVLSLVGAIRRKWRIEVIDYILLAASAVWIISGTVVLILILV